MIYTYTISQIDCAACAKELEEEIGKIEGVSECSIDFGIPSRLRYTCEPEKAAAVQSQVEKIIKDDQGDDVRIEQVRDEIRKCSYDIESIDCIACARELEEEISRLDGVSDCSLEYGIKSRLNYSVPAAKARSVQEAMENIVRQDQGPSVKITPVGESLKAYTYTLDGLRDEEEAHLLENKIRRLEGVSDVELSFGMSSRLSFRCAPRDTRRVEEEVRGLLNKETTMARVLVRKNSARDAGEEEVRDNRLPRIMIGAGLFTAGVLTKGTAQIVFSLAAYLLLGYDVLLKAFRSIGRGQLFDENFLMAVATIAALYLKDWREAAGVMLFYQVGEYFQDRAVARSRKSIGDLMDIRPDFAEVRRNGQYVRVDPEEVLLQEIIRVKPGERVPLDGIVVSGASSLDTSSLTGESKLRDVEAGDEVLSGSVNTAGVLEIEVTKEYGDSTVARILDLVENSESHKAEPEKFITKFSRIYTPAVVFAAIAAAIIVGIVTGSAEEGIRRACTFLVISCPCALVISIPLSFFAGIGGLSSRGVLVKGASEVEILAKVKNIVFDKTGTLTRGTFAVTDILGLQVSRAQILHDAAAAEHFSNHPLALGVRAAAPDRIEESTLSQAQEIAGRGIRVRENGVEILAGNPRMMEEAGIAFTREEEPGSLIYVARDGKYEGCLVLKDQLKEGAQEAVEALHKDQCRVTILSGDNPRLVEQVGRQLGVDEAIGGCLPEDKVQAVARIKKNGVTAFVGDGVNDAPVLAMADTGFAMGALGSDAAIEAADIVLMDDQLNKIPLAIHSARRILRIANENIVFAITIKLITLVLGALGIANMWMAIFADTGVAMLCVLNSMRLLHIARRA